MKNRPLSSSSGLRSQSACLSAPLKAHPALGRRPAGGNASPASRPEEFLFCEQVPGSRFEYRRDSEYWDDAMFREKSFLFQKYLYTLRRGAPPFRNPCEIAP